MIIARLTSINLTLWLAVVLFHSCNTDQGGEHGFNLVDPNATPETKALYRNLKSLSGHHILFGHQDALAYGVGRRDNKNSFSDVKDITGAFPAIYGWDIGHISCKSNIDSIPFPMMIELIKQGYERGGVITISWHELHPKPGKELWSQEPSPAKVLPGGVLHDEFRNKLLLVGDFFDQLRDNNGNPIPVIFRPWHEHNGDWFWWGTHNSSEQEFIDLWRYTVHFLRDTLHIHHLLYAFSPDRSRMASVHDHMDFLYAYPGDDYVDILGFDNYWDVGLLDFASSGIAREIQDSLFILSLRTLVETAEQRNKIAALTETGLDMLHEHDWFTSRILYPVMNDSVARRIAYVLVWRNAWKDHFFAPYPGHPSEKDFIDFYSSPFVLFEHDLPPMYR